MFLFVQGGAFSDLKQLRFMKVMVPAQFATYRPLKESWFGILGYVTSRSSHLDDLPARPGPRCFGRVKGAKGYYIT